MVDFKYTYRLLRIDLNSVYANREYQIQAEKVVYEDGKYPVGLRLNTVERDEMILMEKDQVTAPFDRLYFSNTVARGAGEYALLSVIAPASILVHSNLISVNQDIDVNTVVTRDTSFYYDVLTYQDEWMASVNISLASGLPRVELWNPAGSGLTRVLLNAWGSVQLTAGGATNIQLIYHNAVLANAWNYAFNTYLGTYAAGRIYYQTPGMTPSGPVPLQVETTPTIAAGAWERFNFDLKKAIVIPPGLGLICGGTFTNGQFTCNLHWKDI